VRIREKQFSDAHPFFLALRCLLILPHLGYHEQIVIADRYFPPSGSPALNATPDTNSVLAPLQRLHQRIRWKRWFNKTQQFVWLMAFVFLAVYLADWTIGLRTFTLRICLTVFALTAIVLFLVNGLTCWLMKLDPLGLAQILEARYPSLAERLLTIVQMESDPTTQQKPEFVAILRNDTAQQLASVEPATACPLNRERRAWIVTAPMLSVALLGLCFVPAFREFSGRFFAAWTTPLVPYRIVLVDGHAYALRGSTYTIVGTIIRQDPYAPELTECTLVTDDDPERSLTTAPIRAEGFTFELANLRELLRCRVAAGEARSEWIEVQLVDPPIMSATPKLTLTPPPYLAKRGDQTHGITSNGPPVEILQYSRLSFAFAFDQACRGALMLETTSAENVTTQTLVPLNLGTDANHCVAETLAAHTGNVRAALRLNLAHGLSTTIPLGTFSIHADRLPRFTQALRFLGSAGSLQSAQQYRISPDDVVRLQTNVADEEGLNAIDIEYRVNDNPPNVVKWIHAGGKTEVAINERMPLPKGLKQGDRVQFRLRASDNRELLQGAIDGKLPVSDLTPQVVFAPEGADDGWIQLYVDQAIESFVKQQAEAQRDEVRGVIDAIKKKVLDESQQVEKMKRSIHLQAALTLDQRLHAEKLQTLNREIIEDLLRAGQRFSLNPELARLAEHFMDIAETEMQKAGDSLARFGEKDRPLHEGEKELHTAHDALLLALKKLDRMHDWNKMLAQDRLDQAQIDKLAQRQQDLADRLEKMRDKEPLKDADLAKQIEEIRQEQERIAQQTEQLKDKNRLVQESLASLERQRVEKLAQDAQKLAAEQRAMQAMTPDTMPAELKERLQELAKRQADLAERFQAKPARDAADALKKPNLENAIRQQKEQEKLLQDALGKLLPGVVTNALREQIMRLANQQKDVRTDLERVGEQLVQLNETMLKDRLQNLVGRQRDLHSAIAKLPIDGKDTNVRAGQQQAEQSAQTAAELLAAKDALNSFFAMEKAQQELETLARMLPQTLVKDRSDIKDSATLAKVEQVEKLGAQQKTLRKETEQLLADWRKAVAAKEGDSTREKSAQLAKDLLELAQKGTSPEAKAMAKEAGASLDQAKKAMDAGKDANAKGESSKMQDDDAAKKLELAVKQLQKFAQIQAMKEMNKESPEKTAEALKDGAAQMKIAEANLPKMPKDAQAAMQAAAEKLAQAANQASKQASRTLPKASRTPSAKAGPMPPSGNAVVPRDLKLESFQGKSWGELPGELKTRMIQDYRTRYGDEYAEVIQQYFERLSQTQPKRKD